MTAQNHTAVSLFASGGIGDLGLRAAGVSTLVANELLADRAALFEANFPETRVIAGDVAACAGEIVAAALARLGGRELDYVFATPPCQGMSKNGRGKLLQGVRNGVKPSLDARNQLIVPAVDIVKALKPVSFVIENVPEMASTLIAGRNGELVDILDFVTGELAPLGYGGSWEVVEFADYGAPQRRQRLIAVFTRSEALKRAQAAGTWLAAPSHARTASLLRERWISVDDAIGHLPPLDAGAAGTARSAIPLHSVPLLDEAKYFWVRHTPEGCGAFDNPCVNPACGSQRNATHRAGKGADGINKASRETPIRCVDCGELLPRPWVVKGGVHRLMSGFTSAYRRMRGDEPASALTRNLSYACSDRKLHPRQHRVLSLHEACILHTISRYDYGWVRADGRKVSEKLIREVIGESIPPLGLEKIFRHLAAARGALRAAA